MTVDWEKIKRDAARDERMAFWLMIAVWIVCGAVMVRSVLALLGVV